MEIEFEKLQRKVTGLFEDYGRALEASMTKAAHQASADREAFERCSAELAKKEAYISALEDQISGLKDENRSFMSVSTIVSLTNENAKLKQTISGLERSMFRRQEAAAALLPVKG